MVSIFFGFQISHCALLIFYLYLLASNLLISIDLVISSFTFSFINFCFTIHCYNITSTVYFLTLITISVAFVSSNVYFLALSFRISQHRSFIRVFALQTTWSASFFKFKFAPARTFHSLHHFLITCEASLVLLRFSILLLSTTCLLPQRLQFSSSLTTYIHWVFRFF